MNIAENILENIKCVICNEYEADSMQCYNGHTHCVRCFKEYQMYQREKTKPKCTVCMSKRGWCTNRQIIQLAESIDLKVPCNIGECQEILCLSNLTDHRKICQFKKFKCPLSSNECKTFFIRDLATHVCQHSKTLILKNTNALNLQISDTVNYGPRTILFGDNIIQLQCYVVFDRRCGSKIVIKCHVIHNESEKSEINLNVTNFDMLSDNYFKFHKNLSCIEDFEQKIDDSFILPSMCNYIEAQADTCILSETVTINTDDNIDDNSDLKKNAHNIRYIGDFEEDYQEIYSLKFTFETKI